MNDQELKYKLKMNKPIFLTPALEQFIETLKEEFKPMKNYIVINGKKAELTEEQLKQLGIEVEKKRNNPFNSKLERGDKYYYIRDDGIIGEDNYAECFEDDEYIDIVNCFSDKDFANQVYLHELLNRKLLKYAWDNEAEDCEWKGNNLHYYIFYDKNRCVFSIDVNSCIQSQNVYFSKKDVARQAIKDVIEPFMKEHPEFVW